MKLNRRDWTRMLGIGAAGAPVLMRSALSLAQAEQGKIPKRMVVFMLPNGLPEDQFGFQADGVTLHAPFSPLQPYADRALFMEGIDLVNTQNGSGHVAGPSLVLTGEPCIPNPASPEWARSPGGETLDHMIGRANLSASTTVPLYAFGATGSPVSAQGYDAPIRGQNDLSRAYDALFSSVSDGNEDQSLLEAQRRRNDIRRGLLGFSIDRYKQAQSRLSGSNRRRLEQHADALSDLQSRISDPVVRACTKPRYENFPHPWGHETEEERLELGFEMGMTALACTSTTVVTYGDDGNTRTMDYLSGNYGNRTYLQNVEHPDAYRHAISHYTEGNEAALMRDNIRIIQWYSYRVRRVLEYLQGLEEADGSTALDHTVVLWLTEVDKLGNHSSRNMHFALFGNIDGYFKTGKNVQLGGVPHSNLLTSLAQAYGLNPSFRGSTGTLGSEVHR